MSDAPPSDSAEPAASRAALESLAMGLGGRLLGSGSFLGSATAAQSLAALAIARIATRSLGGAALVSTGLIAKALYDRSQKRRALRRAAPDA